jgi:hypothetical protein
LRSYRKYGIVSGMPTNPTLADLYTAVVVLIVLGVLFLLAAAIIIIEIVAARWQLKKVIESLHRLENYQSGQSGQRSPDPPRHA